MKSSLVCAAAVFALLFTCVSLGQSNNARFPESRSYSPGALWLAWTEAERAGFVRGFIVGQEDGFRSGCRAAGNQPKREVGTQNPCLQQQHLFKKEVHSYEEFITDFYDRFEMDRDVPLRIVLLQSDDKSPDKLHEWLANKSE